MVASLKIIRKLITKIIILKFRKYKQNTKTRRNEVYSSVRKTCRIPKRHKDFVAASFVTFPMGVVHLPVKLCIFVSLCSIDNIRNLSYNKYGFCFVM